MAPRCCSSAARFMFCRLDPDDTGLIATSTLKIFGASQLGLLVDDDDDEHGLSAGTPRRAVGPGVDTALGNVAPAPRRALSGRSPLESSCAIPTATDRSTRSREHARLTLRRIDAVIDRVATAAAAVTPSPWTSGGGTRVDGRGIRGGATDVIGSVASDWGGSGRRYRRDHLEAPTLIPCTDSSTFGRRRASAGELSLATCCRFVEGKRFGPRSSLEGFLRALSSAGRPTAGTAYFYTPAKVPARETAGGASCGTPPMGATNAYPVGRPGGRISVGDGAWGTAGTARWGARGLRRSSMQFVRTGTARDRDCVPGKRGTTPAARGGYPHSTRGGSPTSRSGRSRDGDGAAAGHAGCMSATARTTTPGESGDWPLSDSAPGQATARGFPRRDPRGAGSAIDALLSFDPEGSGTLSRAQLMSAAGQATGIPARPEWAEALVERFEACAASAGGGAALRRGVRWMSGGGGGALGGGERVIDVIAFGEFLRPKYFELSVMTPFGELENHDKAGGGVTLFLDKVFGAVSCAARSSTSMYGLLYYRFINVFCDSNVAIFSGALSDCETVCAGYVLHTVHCLVRPV